MIYITGDVHGYFGRVKRFCRDIKTSTDDVLIILGDAGINFWGDASDRKLKRFLDKLPITLLCVHGNHERRPSTIPSYSEVEWRGGVVYQEENHPNILFAKDGSIFDLEGRKAISIGGAYSVDKEWRLRDGRNWFADEQPSQEIKRHVKQALEDVDWRVDDVLTHTSPLEARPEQAFLPSIDQDTVDTSTEEWLSEIESKLDFKRWWAGHFHIDFHNEPFIFLFKSVMEFSTKKLVYPISK